ncbi:MAG TPA: flagellar hook-basal body complex protein FliE [Egibacteraceae bacterium]|nr:flagellar hook-basal body complex protein FliE [Egibacteraceae bacterium]
MAVPGIGAVGPGVFGGLPNVGGAPRVPGGGQDFGQMVKAGLQNVSNAEAAVDQVAQTIASGGPAEIHDLMAASAKAQVQVDLLVQVRNRAVEAYQEIMRIQV